MPSLVILTKMSSYMMDGSTQKLQTSPKKIAVATFYEYFYTIINEAVFPSIFLQLAQYRVSVSLEPVLGSTGHKIGDTLDGTPIHHSAHKYSSSVTHSRQFRFMI